MGKKDVQLGFRCSSDTHDEIRQIAFEERSSMQAVIEGAVAQFLDARGKRGLASQSPEFKGASQARASGRGKAG